MMNFEDFKVLPWSKSKAYIIGLMLPRLDIACIEGVDNYCIAGTVAHQSGAISDPQLTEHILSLTQLFLLDKLSKKFPIKYNDNIRFYKPNGNWRKNGKKGFSLFLETDIHLKSDYSYEELYELFNDRLMNLSKKIPDEFISNFIAGTVDGHSSFDKTRHLVAIDIDRDPKKHELLIDLIEKSTVEAEINSRGGRKDSSKADQLRYSKKSLPDLARIGLLSDKRLKDIKSV